MNGCHNRAPLNTKAVVQAGWRHTSDYWNNTREPVMVVINDDMSKSCQYQKLKKDDPKCENCRWME